MADEREMIGPAPKPKQRDSLLTEYDGQGFSSFALLLSRGFLPLLATGFVHFVDGEPGTGLIVFAAAAIIGLRHGQILSDYFGSQTVASGPDLQIKSHNTQRTQK